MSCAPAAQAQINWGRVVQGGVKAVQAMTLSNNDIIGYVKQYIQESDSKNKVLGPETAYGKRLATLTQGLTDVDGMPLNFKVYENSEVNAFACADGSVRVKVDGEKCDLCGQSGHDDDFCPTRGTEDVLSGDADALARFFDIDRCERCNGIGHDEEHCPVAR